MWTHNAFILDNGTLKGGVLLVRVDAVLWAIWAGRDAVRWNERRQGVKVWKHLGWSSPNPSDDRVHGLALTQVESVCLSSTCWLLWSGLRPPGDTLLNHIILYWGLVLFRPIRLMEWNGKWEIQQLFQRVFFRNMRKSMIDWLIWPIWSNREEMALPPNSNVQRSKTLRPLSGMLQRKWFIWTRIILFVLVVHFSCNPSVSCLSGLFPLIHHLCYLGHWSPAFSTQNKDKSKEISMQLSCAL